MIRNFAALLLRRERFNNLVLLKYLQFHQSGVYQSGYKIGFVMLLT